MKTVGIVCDNYKVKKFKAELTAAGFAHSSAPWKFNCTVIKITCESSKVDQIAAICRKCEIEFKQSN